MSTQNNNKKSKIKMYIGIGIGVLFAGVVYVFVVSDSSYTTRPSAMNVEAPQNVGSIGGEGNEKINTLLNEENKEKGKEAIASDKSFIPVPTYTEQSKEIPKTEIPKLPVPDKPKRPEYVPPENPKEVPLVTAPKASVTPDENIMNFLAKTKFGSVDYEVGTMYNFSLSNPVDKTKNTESSLSKNESNKKDTKFLDLPLGEILSVTNDIPVNSDVVGTPVVGTIVHGKYSGAKIFGKFSRQGESLVIKYDMLVMNNEKYPFEGYAVDYDEAKAGVSSDVDTHTFWNWTGFIAASFVEGLADAVSSEKTIFATNGGAVVESVDHTMEEQLYMATGKVGEKMAEQLEPNFDRPPTVYLERDALIGVLILDNGK